MTISNGNTSRIAGTPKCMPGPNPAPCFWQQEVPQELTELRDHRSSEQLLDYSDIVIIGAGFAGLSTAHHLVRDAGAKSICILEARGICSGATGRNGGHCRPDLYGHIPTYIDRAGERAGAEIAEFEIANLRAIKKIIDEEKIDCDFTLTRSIDVWCNEDSAKKAEAVYQSMVSHNFEYIDDVVFYTGDKVEGVSDLNASPNCFAYGTKTLLEIEIDRAIYVTDLRCQRRCCMRQLHGWHHVAFQILDASHKKTPRRRRQHTGTYTCHFRDARSLG